MKGDTMRPLIEILEDERTLMQKMESVQRYLLKTDDTDTTDILYAQLERIERDLDNIHKELMAYIMDLTE